MRLLGFFAAAALFGAVTADAAPLVELSGGMTTPVAGARVETSTIAKLRTTPERGEL